MQSLHSVSLFQGYTPADCFMLRARSLTLDSALPKIWLRFTIFTKLFYSVQFSLLWSFLRKLLRRPLTATNKAKTGPFWLCFTHGSRLFYRLGHPPSFYSGVFPTAVINYFALYSEAGSLPRLKLRTAYAFLLTIRRSQRRIRSLLYKNACWGRN